MNTKEFSLLCASEYVLTVPAFTVESKRLMTDGTTCINEKALQQSCVQFPPLMEYVPPKVHNSNVYQPHGVYSGGYGTPKTSGLSSELQVLKQWAHVTLPQEFLATSTSSTDKKADACTY